jgi:hypothetical protein
MHRSLMLTLMLWILACGGDDNGTGLDFENVNGSWTLSIVNMTGGGATCSTSSPIQITLQQNTTTFSGSYGGGGVITCTAPFGSFSAVVGSGSVRNGQISGNVVSFDLGSTAFHQEGTVTGEVMQGTATWTFPASSGSAGTLGELTGGWTATRE